MWSCKGHRGHLKGSFAAGVSKTLRAICLFLVQEENIEKFLLDMNELLEWNCLVMDGWKCVIY